MRDDILGRVSADLLSVPPLISRLIRKKLVMPTLSDAEMDLKIPHFEILRVLREEGTLHPVEIGVKLCIAKAQITHFIDKLVDLNLVEREIGENDRRTINVTITAKGRELLENQDSLVIRAIKDNMASLSDNELETLSNSLRTLHKILSKLQ
jgi:MarR family transcriptional regulator, organic hydroperoxide resistance regulator